jgi:hypothetical protein
MCNGNEVMFEWIVNYHSCVLPFSNSGKESEEGNEKVGVEEWRKLILRSVITLSDFGNAVETTMAVATIILE